MGKLRSREVQILTQDYKDHKRQNLGLFSGFLGPEHGLETDDAEGGKANWGTRPFYHTGNIGWVAHVRSSQIAFQKELEMEYFFLPT